MGVASSEAARARGGWGDDRVSVRFGPPGLQARIAHADQELERQGRLEEERRRERVADFEQASIAASVIDAMERGEFVSARDYATGVGRTPQESREYFSALQDVEDARATAAEAAAYRRWQVQRSDALSGDNTPPSEMDVRELEDMKARALEYRVQGSRLRRGKAEAVAEARRLASQDRQNRYLYRGESA